MDKNPIFHGYALWLCVWFICQVWLNINFCWNAYFTIKEDILRTELHIDPSFFFLCTFMPQYVICLFVFPQYVALELDKLQTQHFISLLCHS